MSFPGRAQPARGGLFGSSARFRQISSRIVFPIDSAFSRKNYEFQVSGPIRESDEHVRVKPDRRTKS